MRIGTRQLKEALKARVRSSPLGPVARRAKRTLQRHQWHATDLSAVFRDAWLVPTDRIPRHLRERQDHRQPEVAARRYFDGAFYLASSPDVVASGSDPFEHYMAVGAREGRRPNPIFDVAGYLYDNPDVADFDRNPLLHYVSVGRRRGAIPHPLFDARWYANRYPEVRRSHLDPYEHFLTVGRHQGRAASAAVEEGTDIEHVRIALPRRDHEAVTIIVPAYKSYALTYRTLYAVSRRTPESIGIKVILADDCPERPLRPLLGQVEGLEITENPTNLGFLMNCNAASRRASGEFIVFLNNDTVAEPGWLEAMVRLARSDPAIGMVGCMLLNMDGSLQEAGNMMFQDGVGYPYGRGERADRPEYGFVRQVDCVSGACFLVRRNVFEEMGRFNEDYRPAFFEEYELAFSVAAAGYKVMYQPASRVVHEGSASYGPSMRDRQTAINHERFVHQWRGVLASRFDGARDLFLARDRRRTRGIILVIDDKVPQPDRNAGGLTVFQYLRLLAADGFKVIYLPHDGLERPPYTAALQQMGIEVLYGDVKAGRWFAKNGRHLDWVLLARPNIAPHYLDLVRRYTHARLLYYTHDLHFVRELGRHETTGDPQALRDGNYLRAVETDLFRRVDCVLTPSADEVPVIQELAPGQEVRVLKPYFFNGLSVEHGATGPRLSSRDAIIFVGGYDHLPNVDAAQVLVRDVMPLVWRDVPSARVLLVGNVPPPEVEALAGERVQVVGYVPDLGPWYAQARVSVSPLRFGSGVKGKIIESLVAGVPVVTTSIGNDGIGLTSGTEALIADDPREIAAQVIRVFRDEHLPEGLAAAGRRVVIEQFSEDRARTQLFEAMRLDPCKVCGRQRRSPIYTGDPESRNWREEFGCEHCHALNRMAALAEVLIAAYGPSSCASVAEALPDLSEMRVHEFGFTGAIHDLLVGSPSFSDSDFFDDVPPGEHAPNGVTCQDLRRLTFDDGLFDLVISQEVFEHVPDPERGFREIFRTLKPGGRHVFTVPYSPGMEASVTRALVGDDGVVNHLLRPEYHGDPIRAKGALVITEYGRDLVAKLERIGFRVVVHETWHEGVRGGYVAVFETVR